MKNLLLIPCGLAGTGKSTFLKKISSLYDNFLYIDKDSINNAFILDIESKKRKSMDFYDEHIKMQTYIAMFALAKDNLLLGKNIILDGYFIDKFSTPFMNELINSLNDVEYNLKTIYFYCNKDILKGILSTRSYWRDSDKLESIETFESYIEEDTSKISNIKFNLELDTEKNIELLIKEFDEFLQKCY